jgi:hypothetical protein
MIINANNSDSINKSINMVVILKPISSAFTLSPIFNNDLTDLSDLPYSVPADDIEFFKLAAQYHARIEEAVNSGRSVILMNYSLLTAQMLYELRQPSGKPNASEWVILSFFLEDKYLENAKLNNTSLLDIKFKEILSILNYPFIKKYELPFGFVITLNYLYKLLNEILSDKEH